MDLQRPRQPELPARQRLVPLVPVRPRRVLPEQAWVLQRLAQPLELVGSALQSEAWWRACQQVH